MKTITSKELTAMAVSEIENIKKFATPGQIQKLNFYTLNPNSGFMCIYGQMTGFCNSDEAISLIKQCAAPISSNFWLNYWQEANSAFIDIDEFDNTRTYFTPLENYICFCEPENIMRIIAYLRGEQDSLLLKNVKKRYFFNAE